MKRFLVTLPFLAVISLFVIPQLALAHFEARDGDMSVELHIDPNDYPVPGRLSRLNFLFDYGGKNFDVKDCNCLVTILENGQQIFKQMLQETNGQPSIWGVNVPFVFPKNDVYKIMLSGSPKTPNAFASFQFSWDFRVDQSFPGLVMQRPSEMPKILIGGGITVVFLGFFGWFLKKEVLDHVKLIHLPGGICLEARKFLENSLKISWKIARIALLG